MYLFAGSDWKRLQPGVRHEPRVPLAPLLVFYLFSMLIHFFISNTAEASCRFYCAQVPVLSGVK